MGEFSFGFFRAALVATAGDPFEAADGEVKNKGETSHDSNSIDDGAEEIAELRAGVYRLELARSGDIAEIDLGYKFFHLTVWRLGLSKLKPAPKRRRPMMEARMKLMPMTTRPVMAIMIWEVAV